MSAAISRLAAIHAGVALYAAWEAFLADAPMSWFGSQPSAAHARRFTVSITRPNGMVSTYQRIGGCSVDHAIEAQAIVGVVGGKVKVQAHGDQPSSLF